MPLKTLILGARGRFGRACAEAFAAAGATTQKLVRSLSGDADPTFILGDALDADSLSRTAEGVDIIVNAVNTPYGAWAETTPRLTRSVIAAARRTGATVIVPGNVYPFGEEMPDTLTLETPFKPSNRFGMIRAEMEAAYRDTNDLQVILLRAGDFMEATASGNWFDSQIVPKAAQGIITYPGPLDQPHAWAYLPDMARAAVDLAHRRDRLPPVAQVGFPGYTLTGAALVASIEEVTGRKMRVKSIPWPLLRAMAIGSNTMRGVVAMSYLWRVPHRIDGNAFSSILPDFEPTPLLTAIEACLPSGSVLA